MLEMKKRITVGKWDSVWLCICSSHINEHGEACLKVFKNIKGRFASVFRPLKKHKGRQ